MMRHGIEARRAETPLGGSVHESATRRGTPENDAGIILGEAWRCDTVSICESSNIRPGTPMQHWTRERDEELKRHEAAGLSAAKIAVQLGTTRGAILGRSNRLRGKVFKSDLERRPRRRSPASVQTSLREAESLT